MSSTNHPSTDEILFNPSNWFYTTGGPMKNLVMLMVTFVMVSGDDDREIQAPARKATPLNPI